MAQSVWTNNTGNGLWSASGNWSPAGAPIASTATAAFTNPALTSVRLDGATNTASHISFGNNVGFTIGNSSGDTANITPTTRNIEVNDAHDYSINLTNGGGSGTSSTGALAITSATFRIADGGKLTLDGRYFGQSGMVRTITKNAGGGTLELTGDYTNTFLQCSLSTGTLVLKGTGTNARLMGLGSVTANGTLRFDSSATNLFTGTTGFHANTGIRLISGIVDLNGNNVATTRIQGTATSAIITNNGTSDSVLTLGNFGDTAGLATSITNPVFSGLIQDGVSNKLGLTLTGGSGSQLTLTLSQIPTYTGATILQSGSSLITAGLSPMSAITMNSTGTLTVDGPLANTAGITIANGTLDVRESFSSGALNVSGGTLRIASPTIQSMPVASLTQGGGTIALKVGDTSADKLVIGGNASFSGGSIAAQLVSAPTGPVVLAEYGSITGTPSVTFTPDLATTRLSSPVVNPITGNKVTVSFSGTAANLVWTGAGGASWDLTAMSWTNGGSASKFFNLDRVTFADGASTSTVSLPATVTPGKMTFTNSGINDYTIDGAGGIAGLGEGLVKNGNAWLYLGGVNTFTGPVQINTGLVQLLTPQALGFTSGVSVGQGGQLDLNSQAASDAGRSYSVTISGDGADTTSYQGAIVNTGAGTLLSGSSGKSGLRHLTLAANASVGGASSSHFDIGTGGSITGGSFTLTKKGDNTVFLNGPVTSLNTVVESGTLSTSQSNGFGTTLRVKTGATASCPNLTGTYVHTTAVTVEDGGILQSGTSVEWTGPFVAEGNLTLNIDQVASATMTFPNGLVVPGNLTRGGAASGGTTTIFGDLDVTGSITISSGVVSLSGAGGSLNATNIAINGAAGFLGLNTSTNISYAGIISGLGAPRQTGSGTTTLSGNNTYSGITSVSAGTLLVNGTQTGTGAVTVNAGATLGGTGTMPGLVTITGTLAPGANGIGTFTTGAATINGTLQIETNGSTTDRLTAQGALALGAASILDFNSIGAAVTGPSHVIASGTSVTGTFATVLDLPPGYTLKYTSTQVLLEPDSEFATWINGFFPGETNPAIIGLGADPDADGQSNAMEFMLAGNPNNASSTVKTYAITADSSDPGTEKELLMTIAIRSGTPAFSDTSSPAVVRSGMTCTVEGSEDLSGFSLPVSVVNPVTTNLPSAPAGYEYRTFSLDASNGLPSKGFLRVKVQP